ncbi:hypothetical protein BIW11_13210 [Tropilaelaps mercedesae]|uniref:Uncharacterized protein n=1 Tax=Tropilaelaps mercedesae TaxID=418985 RepID=A0A1V9X306_9ACAR|nr:hypothetical protein BIW11_13210 [Tropilaelaps mercedesae]
MDPSTVRSALSEMAYLHVPDKDRSKSPSPADSLASSATDISTLPIHGRHGSDGEHIKLRKRLNVASLNWCIPLFLSYFFLVWLQSQE